MRKKFWREKFAEALAYRKGDKPSDADFQSAREAVKRLCKASNIARRVAECELDANWETPLFQRKLESERQNAESARRMVATAFEEFGCSVVWGESPYPSVIADGVNITVWPIY